MAHDNKYRIQEQAFAYLSYVVLRHTLWLVQLQSDHSVHVHMKLTCRTEYMCV